MVIGVVAALTIPSMMNNINKLILGKQHTVFSKKFDEGLRRMRVDGKLEDQYSTTLEFVDEMKKYFAISQICKSENLQNCFSETFTATVEIKDENGNTKETKTKQFTTSLISKAKDLGVWTKHESDVIGIKFADGVNMLLSYNPDCKGPHPGDTQATLTGCMEYVYDVNNTKSPNKTAEDIGTNIVLVNALGFEIIGKQTFSMHNLSGIYDASILNMTWGSKTNVCPSGLNYHAAAEKHCQELGGELPSKEDLSKIVIQIYGKAKPSYCEGFKTDNIIKNPLWQTLNGASTNSFILTTSGESFYPDLGYLTVGFSPDKYNLTGAHAPCSIELKYICIK